MVFSGNSSRVIGHRGWRTGFPDNSLAGIGCAFGVVDMVEVDVRRSADGRLLLSHDPHLGELTVASETWDTLRGVDLGGGQRPVLLEELLAAFPDRAFNLEVKNHADQPGFEVDGAIAVDVVRAARPGDLVSSFHWPSMDAARAARPEIDTGLLVERDGDVAAAVDHAHGLGHGTVIPQWELALESEEVVRQARDLGLRIAVWTVNDVEAALRLEETGVHAIITDDPGRMVSALKERE